MMEEFYEKIKGNHDVNLLDKIIMEEFKENLLNIAFWAKGIFTFATKNADEELYNGTTESEKFLGKIDWAIEDLVADLRLVCCNNNVFTGKTCSEKSENGREEFILYLARVATLYYPHR
jgi:hypothetical protein